VLEEVHVTLSSQPTSFGSVAELKMRIHALEAAGAELARNADYWKARCVEAEHERDEYATMVMARELADDEGVTQVDQSAELRAVKRELLRTQDALATALQSWSGSLLDSAVEAIRQAKKKCAWPKVYRP
jgi:chromosome segregation ATPase